jgi:hypothetical protein
MSEYRDPNDPLMRNTAYEPASSTYSGWGWIAAAVFLVIVLALAFSIGREPNRVAQNDTPPAATHLAPPTGAMNPARAVPGLTPPPAPAPTPNRP